MKAASQVSPANPCQQLRENPEAKHHLSASSITTSFMENRIDNLTKLSPVSDGNFLQT